MKSKTASLPLKQGPMVPDLNDPWADDVLHRKENAAFLTRVVSMSKEPTTIFLNGRWGSGKTYFLDRWSLSLEKKGAQVIKFDAWRDDVFNDPFLPLVGQLHKKLHTIPAYKKTMTGIIEKAGAISMSFIHEVDSFFENTLGIGAERFVARFGSRVAQMAEAYGDAQNDALVFRERLHGLAEMVLRKSKYPLVFIIDELDRCMPLFAVRVLERIKHYFDIPGIVFVIGLDREQLAETIRAVYGDIDVDNYLHRFVDFEFNLSTPDRQDFIGMLWKQYKIDDSVRLGSSATALSSCMGKAKGLLLALSKVHDLSLRQVEMAFRYFVLGLLNANVNKTPPYELVVAMAILKVANPVAAQRWISSSMSAAEVVNALVPLKAVSKAQLLYGLVAAVYTTQYKDPAEIAHEANIFIELCDGRVSSGKEFRMVVPECVIKMDGRELKRIAKIVKNYAAKSSTCDYSHKALLKIAAKMDFQQYEATVYKCMRNDILPVRNRQVVM